jgi:hypothetical protein
MWIQCGRDGRLDLQLQGTGQQLTVQTRTLNLTLNASGMLDDEVYSASVRFTSTWGSDSGHLYGSAYFDLQLQMALQAVPWLRRSDLGIKISGEDHLMGFGNDAFEIDVGKKAAVAIAAHDIDGLRVLSQGAMFFVQRIDANDMNSRTQKVYLQPEQANLFSVALPDEWLSFPGDYDVVFGSESALQPGTQISVRLHVVQPHSSTVVLVTASILGLFAALVLLVLIVLILRNRKRAKDIVSSFVQFELVLAFDVCSEVWDIVSDGLCVAAVRRDENAGSLQFWFAVFFGLAAVASIVTILTKFRLLIAKIRRRNQNLEEVRRQRKLGSGHTEHDQDDLEHHELQEDIFDHKMDLREAMSHVLLAMCEGSR